MTKTIALKLDPKATQKLQNALKDNQALILALNDGSNKYSKMGGSCTIGANFQFVGVPSADPEFPVPVRNAAQLPIFTSEKELYYLAPGLALKTEGSSLTLTSDEGIIDGAVTVTQASATKLTKQDQQDLQGKNC